MRARPRASPHGQELPVARRRPLEKALVAAFLEAVSPAGYFRVICEEKDRRRVCGFPPTFTVLEAVRPRQGRLLHYDQYVHPRGYESVSFASVGFYR